jgi:hypothetical protein
VSALKSADSNMGSKPVLPALIVARSAHWREAIVIVNASGFEQRLDIADGVRRQLPSLLYTATRSALPSLRLVRADPQYPFGWRELPPTSLLGDGLRI